MFSQKKRKQQSLFCNVTRNFTRHNFIYQLIVSQKQAAQFDPEDTLFYSTIDMHMSEYVILL